MATATKKERKEEAYPWKAGASSRHVTNLKQSILRLSISMVVSTKYWMWTDKAVLLTWQDG